MAIGQRAFSVAADVAALDALGLRLAVNELDRGATHVRQLRTLLQLHAVDSATGMSISTVANAALFLGASENRAGRMLTEALLLGSLPGGLEAVDCGLLSVEQSRTVVDHLEPVSLPTRSEVWRRLQHELTAAADRAAACGCLVGVVLPPARLAELLRRWVIAADGEQATARRKEAEQARDVDYRLHPKGLGDLYALGLRGGPARRAVPDPVPGGAGRAVGRPDRRATTRRRAGRPPAGP